MKPDLPIKLDFDDSFFEGEWRSDHYVTPQAKKVWAVELDLLDQFIKFCEKNKITYFVAFGSLLGAIRHGGFIPWDDDIDVVVPTKDYNRIAQLAPEFFKEPYFYQSEKTDPGFSRYFARLRNSQTTAIAIEDADCRRNLNQGIWIDILPMDNIPDNSQEREEWIASLNRIHSKMQKFARTVFRYNNKPRKETLGKRMRYIVGPPAKLIWEKFGLKNPYYDRYEKLAQKYVNVNTKLMGVPWFTQFKDRTYWDKALFGSGKTAAFENLEVSIPEKEEMMLEQIYRDWRKPVKGAAVHQTTLFDPENSYLVYMNDPERLQELKNVL